MPSFSDLFDLPDFNQIQQNIQNAQQRSMISGGTDYDPYSSPSRSELMDQYDIWVDPASMNLLPDYDFTPQQMVHEAFNLRQEGLDAGLSAARAGGAQNLMDLTRQGQEQQAGSLFAGHGGISRAMSRAREAERAGFGEISADFGRKKEESYLGLQQDVYDLEQAYERDFMSAIGDLPEDEWGFGEKPTGLEGQEGGACYGGEACAPGLKPDYRGSYDQWCHCVPDPDYGNQNDGNQNDGNQTATDYGWGE